MSGYLSLLNYTFETPIWVMSISMVIIGMGLGQLMQTLTLAAQNSVEAKDIGVATSSTMFFRQMGGTLGVAVFISILFNRLPDAIKESFGTKAAADGFASAAADQTLSAQERGMAQGFMAVSKDPSLFDKMNSTSGAPDLSTDSSFLTGLDSRLARPFLEGFSNSAVLVFMSAAAVVAVAFVLSFVIKAPALRTKSAAEEKAAAAASAAH
jgi:hypothetical protein